MAAVLCCGCGFFGWGSEIACGKWREPFAEDAGARRAFHAAGRDLQHGEYALAERQFRTLLPAEQVEDEELVSLGIAKCLLGEKRFAEAVEWLVGCRDRFGQGRYRDVFSYLSGHAAYVTKDPMGAAQMYLAAYRLTSDEGLQALALASLEPLLERWLDDTRLSAVSAEAPDGPSGAACHYYSGVRLEQRGQAAAAEKHYLEALRQGRHTRFSDLAQKRLAELRRTKSITTRIGLLYPATGALAEFGAHMRDAAQVAAEAWGKNTGQPLEIVAEDSRSVPLGASQGAQRLVASGVAAVVGPLTSEGAIAAAGTVACQGLVHVLPVASQSGLTSLSSTLYQLNAVPEAAGEALANFMVDSADASTFAVLAPDDAYGHTIGAAFQTAALRRGAAVFPVQFFRPGQADFSGELLRIKRILLREARDAPDFISPDGDTLDERTVPVSLDGFFIPGEADDLVNILPQVRYFNIFTRILGTEGLADRERLTAVAEYLEGAVLASAEHRPAADKRRSRFLSAWKKRRHDEPALVALRTYDAVILAASVLAGKWPTATISDGRNEILEGASGTMTFSPARMNLTVDLYTHQGGRLVPATARLLLRSPSHGSSVAPESR